LGRTFAAGDSRETVVLSDGLGIAPVLAGVALGGLVAAWALRFLTLFDVDRVGVPVYALVSLVVAIGGVVACLLPARGASTVDPMEALRSE